MRSLIFLVAAIGTGLFLLSEGSYAAVCDWVTSGYCYDAYGSAYITSECTYGECCDYTNPCVDTDPAKVDYLHYVLQKPMGAVTSFHRDPNCEYEIDKVMGAPCAPANMLSYKTTARYGGLDKTFVTQSCSVSGTGDNDCPVYIITDYNDYWWQNYIQNYPCGIEDGRIEYQWLPCTESEMFRVYGVNCSDFTYEQCLQTAACAWVNGKCKPRERACEGEPKGTVCAVGGMQSSPGVGYTSYNTPTGKWRIVSISYSPTETCPDGEGCVVDQNDPNYAYCCKKPFGVEWYTAECGAVTPGGSVYNTVGCYRKEKNCRDGLDDNFDGRIDCFDPSCADECSKTIVYNVTVPSNVTVTISPLPSTRNLTSSPKESPVSAFKLFGNPYFYPDKKRYSTPLYADRKWKFAGVNVREGVADPSALGMKSIRDDVSGRGVLQVRTTWSVAARQGQLAYLEMSQPVRFNGMEIPFNPVAKAYPDSQVRVKSAKVTLFLSDNGTGFLTNVTSISVFVNGARAGQVTSLNSSREFRPVVIDLDPTTFSVPDSEVRIRFDLRYNGFNGAFYIDSAEMEATLEYIDNYTIFVDTDGDNSTWELVNYTRSNASLTFTAEPGTYYVRIVKTTGYPDTFGTSILSFRIVPNVYPYIISVSAYALSSNMTPVPNIPVSLFVCKPDVVYCTEDAPWLYRNYTLTGPDGSFTLTVNASLEKNERYKVAVVTDRGYAETYILTR